MSSGFGFLCHRRRDGIFGKDSLIGDSEKVVEMNLGLRG